MRTSCYCYNCEKEFSVVSQEQDNPNYCPFCGFEIEELDSDEDG